MDSKDKNKKEISSGLYQNALKNIHQSILQEDYDKAVEKYYIMTLMLIQYYHLNLSYNQIKKELKENYGDEKEKQRKLDLLKYQLKEIEEANLKPNEDEELEEKRKIVVNSEKISENLKEADGLISENGIDSISMAIRALEKIENIDKKYEDISSNLKNIYYELQEISTDISEHKEEVY